MVVLWGRLLAYNWSILMYVWIFDVQYLGEFTLSCGKTMLIKLCVSSVLFKKFACHLSCFDDPAFLTRKLCNMAEQVVEFQVLATKIRPLFMSWRNLKAKTASCQGRYGILKFRMIRIFFYKQLLIWKSSHKKSFNISRKC